MNQREDEFQKRLLAMFKTEAEERIRVLSSALLEIEKSSGDDKTAIIETVFREAHSLKGAARAVNAREIEIISKALEGVFSALKRKSIAPSALMFDILHQAIDAIARLLLASSPDQIPVKSIINLLGSIERGERLNNQLADLQFTRDAESSPDAMTADQLERMQLFFIPAARENASGSSLELEDIAPEGRIREPGEMYDTLRISTAKLDALLLQTEELLSAKLSADQRIAELRDLISMFGVWKREASRASIETTALKNELTEERVTVGEEQEARFLQLSEFLIHNQDQLKKTEHKARSLLKAEENDRRLLNNMLNSLLIDMKEILMLPFQALMEGFPRMVRDLSRQQGKEIDLIMNGTDIEIDKRILEQIKDPLMHLLRNAIDHGIELPHERREQGKPDKGSIRVSISRLEENRIEVVVADDGAGIEVEQVRKNALDLKLVKEKELAAYDEAQILDLIFMSEFSTSPKITDISGRGLGLAIVREKVLNLGGDITVDTARGFGTSFSLLLPVNMATFRGIQVLTGEQYFVIPTVDVERIVRIRADEIQTLDETETILLEERRIPIVSLAETLGLPLSQSSRKPRKYVTVVVLGAGEKKTAFSVDRVLNEQEVLVKGLGKQLVRVKNIAGATVLGSGKVIPILNVSDLVKTSMKMVINRTPGTAAPVETDNTPKTVLIVEDSITAQMLLKNMMETAGYYVLTANDGLQAIEILTNESVDAVTTDVEMPRMNGLELTAWIRSQEELVDLPVILITAVEETQYRQQAADLGARAYIEKSSFDQSQLLFEIQRCINK